LAFGILLAFTPCIFPMLPILSGIVVGQGSSLNTRRAFLAISELCTCFRADLYRFRCPRRTFRQYLQALFQEPWVIMASAGFYSIGAVHVRWFSKFKFLFHSTRVIAISSRQQGGKQLGAVMMGILSALAIGPCVTAPLTGALIYIGKPVTPIWGNGAVCFGIGMGIPLIIFGTYAGKLMPRQAPG